MIYKKILILSFFYFFPYNFYIWAITNNQDQNNELKKKLINKRVLRKQIKKNNKKAEESLKKYHQNNRNKFGETFIISNKIANIATKMMEKNYNGIESFLSGALCLYNMSQKKNNIIELRETHQYCKRNLTNLSKEAKRRENQLAPKLTENERVLAKNQLLQIFGDNISLISFLLKGSNPVLDCETRGATVTVSFFAGAAFSGYKLRCRSKLGRRINYFKSSIKLGIGLGVIASYKGKDYIKKSPKKNHISIPYSYLNKNRFHLASSVSFAALIGNTINGTNLETDHDRIGGGLGAFTGFGPGTIYKTKEKISDFRELFFHLEMGFLTK